MRLFSTDPNEPGVFAVGQEAFGVFALGQLACGVVAVGQVARGVIAVGQVAVGVVALGQASLGILWAGGMIGVGGRGFGIVLKLLPKVVVERFLRPVLPPLSSLETLANTEAERAWVLAQVEAGPRLTVDGKPLALERRAGVDEQLRAAVEAGHTHACITVDAEERVRPQEGGYREAAPHEQVLVAARLKSWREAPPKVHLEGPLTGIGGLFLRLVGMSGLAVAWWLVVGTSIRALFWK